MTKLERNSISLSERTTWKQRKDLLAFEKGSQLMKDIIPAVINQLFCYGAVCSRPASVYQTITKQELPKSQALKKLT